ncbi:N-terminal methylation site-containing protein [Thermosyntropha lipolytica DSM 11003]|uniref:N-terminal methylation site-containing protein n=1 Tax=Thermosyntropha lipolytica DSM 11003 TaxID=1123382 RepID=A0A1M5LPM9_9FIRM|nr:type II secretion system protein [Thermosyntropha lipolytica]SHG66313.1 N-terminal methylation site-containing protein [Thermosyntropha lipolytica DSM 11003]
MLIKMREMMRRDSRGFTLIELIVVMAILAILALIAIPRFRASTESAKIRAVDANHRTIVSAAQLYYAENNAWPANLNALTAANNGLLTASDLQNPPGANYNVSVDTNNNNKCTITATYGGKEWQWDSENGFTKRGATPTP